MSVHARVRITIDVDLGDTWGDDCTAGQIKKQAQRAAKDALRAGFVIDGLVATEYAKRRHATIVGTPEVTAIVEVLKDD